MIFLLQPFSNAGVRSPRARRRTARKHNFDVLQVLIALVVFACSSAAMISVLTLHLGVRPVLTGSMRPDYGPGALLVTRQVPVSAVVPGMIVLFVPPGEHAEYAHRVTSVRDSPDGPVITTKGDANAAADPWHARITAGTIDEVVASAPGIGRVLIAVRGTGQILLALVGAVVAMWGGLRWLLGSHSRPSARRASSQGT